MFAVCLLLQLLKILGPPKSLPRASPDRPRALKRLSTAFKSLPSGPQENSKSLLYRPAYSLGQIITIIDQ